MGESLRGSLKLLQPCNLQQSSDTTLSNNNLRRNTMSLGNRIKTLREQKHMTQQELAKRTGISQATISRLEHHLMRQLKSDAMRKLAVELNTTIDFLAGKEDVVSVDGALRSDPALREFIELYITLDLNSRENSKSYMKYLSAVLSSTDAQ